MAAESITLVATLRDYLILFPLTDLHFNLATYMKSKIVF